MYFKESSEDTKREQTNYAIQFHPGHPDKINFQAYLSEKNATNTIELVPTDYSYLIKKGFLSAPQYYKGLLAEVTFPNDKKPHYIPLESLVKNAIAGNPQQYQLNGFVFDSSLTAEQINSLKEKVLEDFVSASANPDFENGQYEFKINYRFQSVKYTPLRGVNPVDTNQVLLSFPGFEYLQELYAEK